MIEARRRKDQWSSRDLRRAIKAGIQEYRRRRVAEEGSVVEYLLAFNPTLIRESWIRMRGWYKAAVDRPPTPARVALVTMTEEREELYRHVPQTGYPMPVGDLTFLVDDDILEDEYIAWEVHRIFLNHLCGPSGMQSEHLRQ